MLGKRRIFIGDIHGESQKLFDLIESLGLREEDEFIFLGDYIDRGSDPAGVLDILRQVKEELPQTRFLWGNHEVHLYEWLTEGNPLYINTVDGVKTLQYLVGDKVRFSRNNVLYGLKGNTPEQTPKDMYQNYINIDHEVKEEILTTYKWLFDSLEYEASYPEQVAVHGGLNFTKDDPITETSNYQKVNARFFVEGSPLPKPVIIGHTIKEDITVTEDGKMVAVDTGCGSGGKLSALIYYPLIDSYTDQKGRQVNVATLEECQKSARF